MHQHLQTSGVERRREDLGPITGRSCYVDDLTSPAGRPAPLHIVFVRSPYGPPAIVNAVLDALAPLGITSVDMPLRPEKIWALMQAGPLAPVCT